MRRSPLFAGGGPPLRRVRGACGGAVGIQAVQEGKAGAILISEHHLPQMLLDLGVAFVLGLPIGWERGAPRRPGLRTYPLLAMAACAYFEIGLSVFGPDAEAQARVFQGVVSGVGFIGAGAIIKGSVKVRGLATAVSLWVTVAIGIAAAYQLFVLGIVLSGATVAVLLAFHPDDLLPEPRSRGERGKSG